MQQQKAGKSGKEGHSEACRRRIEKEMMAREEGRRKLDESEARVTEAATARELERQERLRESNPDVEEDHRMAIGRPTASVGVDRQEKAGTRDERMRDEQQPMDMQEQRMQHTHGVEEDNRMAIGQPTTLGGAAADAPMDLSKLAEKTRRTRGVEEDSCCVATARPKTLGEAKNKMGRNRSESATHDAEGSRRLATGPPNAVLEAGEHRPDIAEIYSPRRVTLEAVKFGMKAGEAMDLTTGLDFNDPRHRDAAPMCTMFSTLQNLSRWSREKEQKLKEAKAHMEFALKMYREQRRLGGHFLHEHDIMEASMCV